MSDHPPVLPDDRDAWRESDPTSWELWLSFFERSLRGDAWKETGRWALENLRAKVGNQWLARTHKKYAQICAESALPTFFVLAPAHTIAFAQLLELTLRLDLLSERAGMGKIRKILLNDPREEPLLHLRLQLEVGALAVMASYGVGFERRSKRESWPADVVVELDDELIAIETAVILLNEPTRDHHDATDRLFERLRRIEIRYDVDIAGEFDRKLDGAEMDQLVSETERQALKVHQGGPMRTIQSLGALLTVARTGTGDHAGRQGPVHRFLVWHRTERILQRKAEQSAGASSVWLRVDAQDGLWQFTPWAATDLSAKLGALIGPVRHALASYPHIKGLVLTSGAVHAQGVFHDESAREGNCIALRRLIEPLRVRETMIITLDQEAVPPAEMWHHLYDEEPEWLDGALRQKDLPSTQAIFASGNS